MCSKHGFGSKGEALARAKAFPGKRAYRCDWCSKWHLTHKPKKRRGKVFK